MSPSRVKPGGWLVLVIRKTPSSYTVAPFVIANLHPLEHVSGRGEARRPDMNSEGCLWLLPMVRLPIYTARRSRSGLAEPRKTRKSRAGGTGPPAWSGGWVTRPLQPGTHPPATPAGTLKGRPYRSLSGETLRSEAKVWSWADTDAAGTARVCWRCGLRAWLAPDVTGHG